MQEPCRMARQNCYLKFMGCHSHNPAYSSSLCPPILLEHQNRTQLSQAACGSKHTQGAASQSTNNYMGFACFTQWQNHKFEVSFISLLINHLLWKKQKMVVFSESEFYSVRTTFPPFFLPCSSVLSLPPTNCSGQR